MADFNISGRMKVKHVIDRFKETFSTGIRIYNGAKFADGDATIASLRREKSDIRGGKDVAIRGNMLVKNVEKLIEEEFGVKVQIEDKDGKLADNDVTLGSLSK